LGQTSSSEESDEGWISTDELAEVKPEALRDTLRKIQALTDMQCTTSMLFRAYKYSNDSIEAAAACLNEWMDLSSIPDVEAKNDIFRLVLTGNQGGLEVEVSQMHELYSDHCSDMDSALSQIKQMIAEKDEQTQDTTPEAHVAVTNSMNTPNQSPSKPTPTNNRRDTSIEKPKRPRGSTRRAIFAHEETSPNKRDVKQQKTVAEMDEDKDANKKQ
jgi:hypothetical protein